MPLASVRTSPHLERKVTQLKIMTEAKDFSSLFLTTTRWAMLPTILEMLDRVLLCFRALVVTERMSPLVLPPALWGGVFLGFPPGLPAFFQGRQLFLRVLLY